MAHNSIITSGTITSTNVDPYQLKEHLDTKIRTVSPDATPLVTLSQYALRGPKPTGHKVIQMEYDEFDHFDYCSKVYAGKDTAGTGYERFALIKLEQPSRPFTKDDMYYSPQESFFIQKTAQNVEIVMTPTSSKWMGDNASTALALPVKLTNGDATAGAGTATVCIPGHVVVRVIEEEPFRNFTNSDVIYYGKTIKESQDIQIHSHQGNLIYNSNFVEHKEDGISITEDMKNWVQTKGGVDWEFQVEELAKNFKKSIEYTMMWGVRNIDFSDATRAKRTMAGLYHAIKTNVAVYNPSTITDFEEFFMNFATDMGFKTAPNGSKKMMLVGNRLLQRFNRAFKDYRRITNQVPSGKIGLDLDTYVLPGGFEIKLVRTDMLRMGTGFEDWGFIIDPKEIEMMVVKNFETRVWQKEGGRDYNLAIEWQGTIAWHREQVHALLKTA